MKFISDNDVINQFKQQIKSMINIINAKNISSLHRLILVRSIIERDAMLNFILEKDTTYRIELFHTYSILEWYSHIIRKQDNETNMIITLFQQLNKYYSRGFNKYFSLIKKRTCKYLIEHIHNDNDINQIQRNKLRLSIVNSSHAYNKQQSLKIISQYAANHPLNKLPFPYRIVLGKSITYLVLHYTLIGRELYWFLTNVSHGILLNKDFDTHIFDIQIDQLIKHINTLIK